MHMGDITKCMVAGSGRKYILTIFSKNGTKSGVSSLLLASDENMKSHTTTGYSLIFCFLFSHISKLLKFFHGTKVTKTTSLSKIEIKYRLYITSTMKMHISPTVAMWRREL